LPKKIGHLAFQVEKKDVLELAQDITWDHNIIRDFTLWRPGNHHFAVLVVLLPGSIEKGFW